MSRASPASTPAGHIHLRLGTNSIEEHAVTDYRIAGISATANRRVMALEAFRQAEPDHHSLPPLLSPASGGTLIYAGKGWVGGAWRQVRCQQHAESLELQVDAGGATGAFSIAADGGAISTRHLAPGTTQEEAEMTLLGPCLLLSLALRGIFSLHASAVDTGAGAAVFVGPSGVGKSTLAASLGRNLGWPRAADDIFPLHESAVARPHFPQLKLGQEEQWPKDAAESLPIAAIYFLRHDPTRTSPRPLLTAMPRLSIIQGLLKHTVAARLFPADLVPRHLEHCIRLASMFPVQALTFAHVAGSLDALGQCLRQHLKTLPTAPNLAGDSSTALAQSS